MRTQTLLGTMVFAVFVACASNRAPSKAGIDVQPGITVDIPAGYCVSTMTGSGSTLYVVRRSNESEDLASFYTAYQPGFPLDCSPAQRTTYSRNGLIVTELRGVDGCAEFLVHLPPPHEELGALHLVLDLGAVDDPEAADELVHSVRPYSRNRGHSSLKPSDCDELDESPNPSLQRTSPGRSPGFGR